MNSQLVRAIPEELCQYNQWCGCLIQPSKDRPGKADKIPIDPRTRKFAKTNDPATWGTFSDAVGTAQTLRLEHIGFVLSADDPFFAGDLDSCVTDGQVEPWAQAIVDELDTYTEISVSGHGLRIFGRGKLPAGGRKKGAIEFYDSGRFVTVTGNVLGERRTIEDRQAAITAFHARIFGEPSTPQGGTTARPVNLEDTELIERARQATNGAKFADLWAGKWSGSYPSQSEADSALATLLLFWTGGDTNRADSLFRQSGLYREKWDKAHYSDGRTYGQATLERARANMTDFYDPARRVGGSPRAPAVAMSTNGDEPPGYLDDEGQEAPASGAAAASSPKPPRRKVTSVDLIAFLTDIGYTFRLNLCDDSLEVNGQRISDVTRAAIRSKLRDAGFGKYLAAADDAILAHAGEHAYHPVREYLASLTWDGDWHIAKLASYFQDKHGMLGAYLRHWLIGAVARAHTGQQNAVLVLDGAQGVGKSLFARWLCPIPKLFVDSGVNPDDKDSGLLAIRSFVWEVSELGATTRRADIEALKGFLSREVFTLRPPYGHFEIVKPALASYLGTVNNSSGIFSDPTGSRRYWATTLTAIDWQYSELDVNQVWAEAHEAYRSGETGHLSGELAQTALEINREFEIEDPVENFLRKSFQLLDPADTEHWTSTVDILTAMQENGLQGNTRANAMALAAVMKRLGHERTQRNNVRGYAGVG